MNAEGKFVCGAWFPSLGDGCKMELSLEEVIVYN
jgi:hypothetical protein